MSSFPVDVAAGFAPFFFSVYRLCSPPAQCLLQHPCQSDSDSDIDIRQSGVVAKKYTTEAISTDDDNGFPPKETVPRSGQEQAGCFYVMFKVY